MSRLMINSAFSKSTFMHIRTLRVATGRLINRFKLSPASGGLGSVLNQPALIVTRQIEMLNIFMGYEVLFLICLTLSKQISMQSKQLMA